MRGGLGVAGVIALGAGLVLVSLGQADDEVQAPVPSHWFKRLFSGPRKEADPKKDNQKKPALLGPSRQAIFAQAKADLLRRQEVCDRLREVALQTGDQELHRKAEHLDQRAFEVYLQKTGGTSFPPGAALQGNDQFHDDNHEIARPGSALPNRPPHQAGSRTRED